ncbi:hypothetical protein [Sunxiuqinia indica]|uniref:hypothetical protein n=1 Tax=Sunxiuqinia indica TaxID=2692584 RepID=UPI001358EDD1|nr:hypothetical protein [Sunxiuqinia indica]
MAEGWIKLHRAVQDHWTWQDDKYFKWWLIVLLNVNHKSVEFPVGDDIFTCNPGQSFRSIDKWTALFSCSKPTTIKFFKMLEKDKMITRKNMGKGNRRKHLLTVLNWKEYQQEETENFTESKPKALPKVNPNKNDKNEKNEEEVILSWRNSFEIYLDEMNSEYDKLINDHDFLEKQERYHPNIDILLSLEKAKENFWGTEAGWNSKKKKKSKSINWKLTFTNAIELNKVWRKNEKTQTTTAPKRDYSVRT